MENPHESIVVLGPTAIGKTKLAIELAQYWHCNIISADSRQFYKEMSIGTAVPNDQELRDAPHFLIQHKSIHDDYNVGLYEKEAVELVNKLFEEREILILVGGSGLYADSIMNGIDDFPEIPTSIRESLIKEYNSNGLEVIQNKLKKLDIEYYNEVDLNNLNRIIRALEIIEFTGKKFSLFRTKKKKDRIFQSHVIVMECDRDKLYHRINHRVDDMIEKGLEKEALGLKDYKHLNTLNTVGYKEFFKYFEDKISYTDAIDKVKQNTRNYAKRQITWLKKYNKSIKVYFNQDVDKIINELYKSIK